ncbi:MAG: TusE/DsrC/DsvC family sulfur relay protein [Verrucomicrobiales bacterium]|nr:TusE/DsrC/DsvC family sulfur relay protein [Verrucomicrobiota bacterium JB025]
MPQKTINGTVIDVNEEGYMTDHSQWNREIAAALAAEENITLTDAHWKILDFISKDFGEKGVVPGMRRMNKIGNIPTKELYALFPDGPIKKAAKISGHPKPASCV